MNIPNPNVNKKLAQENKTLTSIVIVDLSDWGRHLTVGDHIIASFILEPKLPNLIEFLILFLDLSFELFPQFEGHSFKLKHTIVIKIELIFKISLLNGLVEKRCVKSRFKDSFSQI